MSTDKIRYEKYGQTPAERVLLSILRRWEPHLKFEADGHQWLVKSASELRDDGLEFSDRTIRRVVSELKKRGIIAVRLAAHPAKKGVPSLVYWIRFCRPNGTVNPATMAPLTVPPCPGQPGHHGTVQDQCNTKNNTCNTFQSGTGEEPPVSEDQENDMKVAQDMDPALFSSTLSNGGLQLPKKPKPKKLQAKILYDDARAAYTAKFEKLTKEFLIKQTGMMKPLIALLNAEGWGYEEWAAGLDHAFGNWVGFVQYAGDSIPEHLKGSTPKLEFLSTYAPLLISYWNLNAGTVVVGLKEGSSDGVTKDEFSFT